MACTKGHVEWSREDIEALHYGREIVDGKPRMTYREIAELIGKTQLRCEKAAVRYGATSGSSGRPFFTDSEKARIKKLLEYGVGVRMMCANDLQALLASQGLRASKNSIRIWVNELGNDMRNQYRLNVARKRRTLAHRMTLNRVSKINSKKRE